MSTPNALLPARCALVEYATYDATLLFGDFLRRALLFVYSDNAVLVYRPYAQRSLVFRLLTRSDRLSRRFLRLRLEGIRGPMFPANAGVFAATVHSREVRVLATAVRNSCRAEIASLTRVLRLEDPEFDLNASWLSPLHFSQTLEECLDELGMTPIEQSIVFDAWSGLFSLTMKNTYKKYLQALYFRIENPSAYTSNGKDTCTGTASFAAPTCL
jgi:hypothetical protein